MSRAAYKKQSHNPGVTEHVVIPGRDHSLTIDDKWREVADNGARLHQALRLRRDSVPLSERVREWKQRGESERVPRP